MYGKDVERVIQIACNINALTIWQINSLVELSDYRISMINHVHNVFETPATGRELPVPNTDSLGPPAFDKITDQLTYPDEYPMDDQQQDISPKTLYEKERLVNANSIIQPLRQWHTLLKRDVEYVHLIENNLYISRFELHNNYGSPYTEIYELDKRLDYCMSYVEQHPRLQWIGEKYALTNLLQLIISGALDVKYAFITYFDFIQRGYDQLINNGIPSITWEDFIDIQTTGNIKQQYEI